MHDQEWKKVLSGILNEKTTEREDTYEWVKNKHWVDETFEHLKGELEHCGTGGADPVRVIEAMAAIDPEKTTNFLAKKRVEYGHKLKDPTSNASEQQQIRQLMACIDDTFRKIISSTKTKGDPSLKNMVQKSFALK